MNVFPNTPTLPHPATHTAPVAPVVTNRPTGAAVRGSAGTHSSADELDKAV